MRVRPWTVVALCALSAILAPGAAAQTGGTPVPGPGDPCPATYPGDDAKQNAIARWMARAAALRDLPEELPVMAGLAESGLRNLGHAGGSYFGFFGMHRSLNAGPYRGFPGDPELQLRWFTDTAVLVRQRRMAEGDEDFGAESSGYGLWIADVERPAPENRDGYQPFLDDADALLNGSCGPDDHTPDEQPPGPPGPSGAPSARRDHAPSPMPVGGVYRGSRSGAGPPRACHPGRRRRRRAGDADTRETRGAWRAAGCHGHGRGRVGQRDPGATAGYPGALDPRWLSTS